MNDEDIKVKAVRLADENYHYYGTERSEELGLAVRALADEVERLRGLVPKKKTLSPEHKQRIRESVQLTINKKKARSRN